MSPQVAVSVRTSRLGMCLALAAIGMLFLAFTSAYVFRQGLDPAWRPLRMPVILIPNTLVLLASSAALEKARRERSGHAWLSVTLSLGLLFVMGQYAAWLKLASEGVYLATSAHSSFFYLLTALHGAHLMGGIVVLGCTAFFIGQRRRRWLDVSAIYWHFMAGLWLFLLVLLFGMS